MPFTQFDVDQRCRIITSDNSLLAKTFGIGLAFPLRTNDGMVMPEFGKPNPRADSFSLYSNYVANTLLQNLLPKSKIDMKSHVLGRTSNHRTAPKVVTTVVKQTPVKTVTRKKPEPKPESKPDQITAPPILPQRAVSQGLHTTQDPKTFEKALEKAADKKPI